MRESAGPIQQALRGVHSVLQARLARTGPFYLTQMIDASDDQIIQRGKQADDLHPAMGQFDPILPPGDAGSASQERERRRRRRCLVDRSRRSHARGGRANLRQLLPRSHPHAEDITRVRNAPDHGAPSSQGRGVPGLPVRDRQPAPAGLGEVTQDHSRRRRPPHSGGDAGPQVPAATQRGAEPPVLVTHTTSRSNA